jgi:CheY-like chemotaxis protein
MTRRHSGLGLGLAIVRHLTELHGGQVEARSGGMGKGATFVVRLPASEPGADRLREGASPPRREAAPIGLGGLQILVVEDHADSARLIREILEQHGARVSIAATVAEAWKRLTAGGDDVQFIVSDIGMPDGDGYDLIRRYRAHELRHGLKRVPAIALTAFVTPDDRERAYTAGFDAHAAKPIVPDDLVKIVARTAAEH